MAEMTAAQRDAFLREPRIAVLSTLMASGAPAAVPIWFEWDGSRARMFTSAGSPKVARIRRDPRVTLTIAEPVHVPEAWVSIEGTASIESGGFELAQVLAPHYYPPDQAKQALESWAQMPAEDWVTIVIEPTRIRTNADA